MQDGTPLTRLGRNCLRLAGFLAVLMIAVIVNYLVHGGAESLNPVAQAAERTVNLRGGHFALELRYSVPGETAPLVGTGAGVFDTRTGRTDMNLSMPVPGHGSLSFEAVGTPQKVFIRGSAFEGKLPAGKTWLAMESLPGAGEKSTLGSSESASGTLEALAAVGNGVEREDQQIVRGDLTTRYKAEVDPAKVVQVMQEKGETKLAQAYEALVEKAPQPVDVEVWIDGKGIVRQVSTTQQVPVTDEAELTVETRMQFYDFGPHPTIVPPEPSQVFDISPAVRAQLGLENGSDLSS